LTTRVVPASRPWSYAYLGDQLLARFDNSGNIEHVVGDHIGYPLATISYTGTIEWQPDPEPFKHASSLERSIRVCDRSGGGADPRPGCVPRRPPCE
jgi:hypothetical protein